MQLQNEPKYMELDNIMNTWRRLREENYRVSQSALRRWVKQGAFPVTWVGQRALLYYPNVIAFLTTGQKQSA